MKDYRDKSLDFDDILMILVFLAVSAVIGWSIWNAYRSMPKAEPQIEMCAEPVVAPTNQTQSTNSTGKSSFGSEEYIWDNW